ncbi:MAG TPA: endonuclease III [Chitinophagaceae bacterium]|nr:endonuclease III [Chitinophagaceae bacterium]
MTITERYRYVVEYFEKHMPDAETELVYHDPYQLLVAVILSAQCTDKRVNQETPALFARYPGPHSLAKASFDDLLPFIRHISYPNSKTRHLIAMAEMVVERFGGKIPSGTDDLMQLPGVGRKTAHVLASVLHRQPLMAVDTHVFRVSARIGLTRGAKTPLQAEMQLIRHLPEEKIHLAHHWLILHGRYTCLARKPKCPICGLRPVCRYYSRQPQPLPDPPESFLP